MKAYIAQLPPLGWVAVMLPVLVIARAAMTALATTLVHGAIPTAVCNFLRLL
jgi:hypothetical protein